MAQRQGCTLVDTTCGSVLNVWKNVRRYAQDGFTSVIHGKVHHEETQATASQAIEHAGRAVPGRAEPRPRPRSVCDYIRRGGDRTPFLARFGEAASAGFDPDRDLGRVGLANQTTMLMSESLEIGEMFRRGDGRPLRRRRRCPSDFRAFDTICSATQDRQDAVVTLLDELPLDLMLVDRRLQQQQHRQSRPDLRLPPADLPHRRRRGLVSAGEIRHRPVAGGEAVTGRLAPGRRPALVGLTAGASTPDTIVGLAVKRLSELANG